MLVREEELFRRFARYSDEELERVLAVGRTRYSWDELTAASWELSQRQQQLSQRQPPPQQQAVQQPARVTPRPKSRYMFIDLLVDALLCGFLVWAVLKLWEWTLTAPGWEWWGGLAFYALASALLSSVVVLRQKWRAREWRD